MNLSNDLYHISITKEAEHDPTPSIDTRLYDLVLDPYGYIDAEFRTVFLIIVKSFQSRTRIGLVGSFFSNPDHCAVLDGANLIVLMNDIIVHIHLESMEIISHKEIGDTPYFALYLIHKGYIVHGELEILRLDNAFNRIWDFRGSDIFVTQDATHEPIIIAKDQILLEDWNGIRYALDMDGKLIWDTYKR